MPGLETFIGSKLKGPVQRLMKWQAGLECVDASEKKEDLESHQIVVHDDRMYFRIIYKGAIAFGEAYMDGDWTPGTKLFDVLKKGIETGSLESRFQAFFKFIQFFAANLGLLNPQSIFRSRKVAKMHYDLGNDLYEKMLCSHMQYTCAYWKGVNDLTWQGNIIGGLEQAQRQKLDLIGRKLKLKPGMRVLELGGGFGGLSYYLCTHFGVSVHACDLSVEHEVYSKEHFAHENKTFEIIDYRDFLKRHIREGTPLFDRVVSVGMMEHVGPRNFPNFFRQIRKVIKPQGLFLLHTIGNSVDDRNQDPWFEKYVFPGACIPGPQTFFQPGCIGDGWKLEDWHNFGVDYKRTCQAWWDNSIAARGELPAEKYDERFWRMWEYYLQGSAAGFAARSIHLWQFVLSPQGLPDDFEGRGGYEREN